jgi:hypothetical protein
LFWRCSFGKLPTRAALLPHSKLPSSGNFSLVAGRQLPAQKTNKNQSYIFNENPDSYCFHDFEKPLD